jgi:hypothetical protein
MLCRVCVCVWKIAYELTRFRVFVILSPYLSNANEKIRALQTRVVTEQTVVCLWLLKYDIRTVQLQWSFTARCGKYDGLKRIVISSEEHFEAR